jgi:1-phosphofructokinase family hexose kinase
LTVTPNPTIDRILFVHDFAMQDVVRAEREVVAPSGKGLDVSIILHDFGVETLAIGLAAGLSGEMLAALVAERGTPACFLPATGHTRVAALLTDVAARRQSTILAHTLTADAAHLTQLLDLVARHAPGAWGLVCAGSLPPGLPGEAYARLLEAAHDHGLVTVLDSSGPGLRYGVTARPHILKVNAAELAGLAPDVVEKWRDVDTAASPKGAPAGAPADLVWLAAWLAAHRDRWARAAVVVTLGGRGLLAATPEGCFYAPALSVPFVSPAGAGDAVSAGLMLARRRGQSWRDALALGAAMAAACVTNPGTCDVRPDQVDELLPRAAIHALTQIKAEV